MVGREVPLQRRDDRYPPAHARLVEHVLARFSRQRQQLRAMLGHHLLVSGDDVAALPQAALDVLVGRLLAAHHLNNDVAIR